MASKRLKAPNGEGSVFQRPGSGGKPWVAEVTMGRSASGKPRRIRRSAATRAEANKLRREMIRQRDQGQLNPRTRQTVATFARYWIDDVKSHEVRATTASGYDDLLQRYVLPTLGSMAMADLQAHNIQHLLTHLRDRGLAKATVKQVRSILSGLCKHAALMQVIAHNPVLSTPTIKTSASARAKPTEVWTPEEAQKALQAVTGTEVEIFLLLMLYTGMRPGEALGLRWQDIDKAHKTLIVTGTLKDHRHVTPTGQGTVVTVRNPPKTAASHRQLPIPEMLWRALEGFAMRQDIYRVTNADTWQETGYVLTTKNGTPMQATNLRRRLNRLLQEAGVRTVRLHSMRHFVARSALEQDIPLEHVSQALGHTRLDTTKQIYAGYVQHLNDQFSEKLADFINPLTSMREEPASALFDQGYAGMPERMQVYPRE